MLKFLGFLVTFILFLLFPYYFPFIQKNPWIFSVSLIVLVLFVLLYRIRRRKDSTNTQQPDKHQALGLVTLFAILIVGGLDISYHFGYGLSIFFRKVPPIANFLRSLGF